MRLNLKASLAVLLLVSAASAPAPASPAAPAPPPTIYNLGLFGGTSESGSISSGDAINNSGQVSGTCTTADGSTHAFLYTGTPGSDGVMHDLGTLAGPDTRGAGSFGRSINDSGQVAGTSNTGFDTNYTYHAFLYTGTPGSDGVMHDLGNLAGTDLRAAGSKAEDINNAGQIVGVSITVDYQLHAFLYTGTPGSDGVMYDLGNLGGTSSQFGYYGPSINDSGQVVVTAMVGGDAYHAFLYTGTPGSGGVMHDLGTLGGWDSSAIDINDASQVTGISSTAVYDTDHAFLYTGTPGSDGVMHDLGALGGTYSRGNAINARGQVAGKSDGRAFLYTGTPGSGGVMHDLNAWLDANNPTEGANWGLTSANDLNDNGLITGQGYYDDGPGGLSDGLRAFLLDASSLLLVPEPSSLALLTLAVPAFLRRRTRRSVHGDRVASRFREGRTMRLNLCAFVAVLLSVLAASAPAAAAVPAIYNLGTLFGTDGTEAAEFSGFAINDNGHVVGNSIFQSGDWQMRAFLYTGTPGSGGVWDLGSLRWGSGNSSAFDMNDGGQVVGESNGIDFVYNPTPFHAFLYIGTPGSGGYMYDLGTLAGHWEWSNSSGHAINNSGQVVGWSHTSSGAEHAFLYTGVMHDLGTLGGAYSFSVGADINDSGQVVGESYDPYTAGNPRHAFLYTGTPGVDGVMHDLGTLGGPSSGATHINAAGDIMGWSTTADGAQHAFLYTGTPGVNGVMYDMGTLGGGQSYAVDINAAGDIVGYSQTADGEEHPFVYTGTPGVAGVMIDLDAWLDANNPTEGAKWTLYGASAVNDNGLVTGGGIYDDGPGGLSDGYRVFLLDASSLLLEPPDLPGDFNHDGTVDAADYVVWRKSPSNFGGDPNGYNTWRAHFGETAGSGSVASANATVPEPSTLVMLIVAAGWCVRRDRAA